MVEDTMPGEMPDYTANPSQRTPCILVLDASGSMSGKPIEELNKGIADLVDYLQNDSSARTHCQVAGISVGGPANDATVVMDWTDAKDLDSFKLEAANLTPLGKGVNMALDMIEQQKYEFKRSGINYTRPWMVIITDGAPNDERWSEAAERARNAELGKHCKIYPLAVQNANQETLQQFAETPVAKLAGVNFREFFKWLSASMSQASASGSGEKIQLPSTNAWQEVET